MKRLIRSIVIFTFVMVATIAFNRVEVRAAGWDDSTVDLSGCGSGTEDEWRAANEAYYAELAAQWAAEEADQSSTSSSSNSNSGSSSSSTKPSTSTTQSAPKYTDAEIEAAWVESGRTEATCANDGVITYKNSLTGKTKAEAIPATGEHTYELTEHVDSTCINNGYDAYTCTVCGDSYKDEIATTGHTEGEPQITKYAGSFSTGESKTYCTSCGELVATTTIPQTFPLPLSIVGAFGAGAVVFLIGLLSLLGKKK